MLEVGLTLNSIHGEAPALVQALLTRHTVSTTLPALEILVEKFPVAGLLLHCGIVSIFLLPVAFMKRSCFKDVL